MTPQQMIEELKNFDTPSITNVVATYPSHPLCPACITLGMSIGIRTRACAVCIQTLAAR